MKHKILCFVLASLVSLVLVAEKKSFAYGKTWVGRDLEWQIKNSGFYLGPFHARTVFMVSNAGFDSNVYYGAVAEPVEDLTFTAGLAFDVYLPLKKKLIFHIYESPQYVYYKETDRERTWNNYFRGEAHLVFNRFVVSAGVGRSDAKERWNTETDIPIFRREDSVQGSLFWQLAKRTSSNFSYRMARYEYEESSLEAFMYAEKLNREETYFNFTGYREISLRTRLFLDAEYGFFDFENPANQKNSKSYSGYGGLEFSPLGKIRGRLKIGYKHFDSVNPQRKDYRGIVGDTSVSARLMEALAARASYKRDVQFSVWSDNTYFLESHYGAGASLYISKNIRLDYNYYPGTNDYPHEL